MLLFTKTLGFGLQADWIISRRIKIFFGPFELTISGEPEPGSVIYPIAEDEWKDFGFPKN